MEKKELNRKQRAMLEFASHAGVEFIEDDENIYLKTDEFDKDYLPLHREGDIVELDDNKIHLSQNAFSIQKFNFSNYNFNEYIEKTVDISLDEKDNLITVKQEERHSFDYVTIGDDSMTNYARYNVLSNQKVTEFRANGDCLKVVSADVDQMIKEDTMGGGNWIVVNFNSIKDFDSNSKMRFLARNNINDVKFDNTDYSIPEGSNIIDCSQFIKNSKVKSYS